uniref:Aminoglycoside phosphotransferase domain-containing protein n=1 Tax=Kwoniella dejecticola CBS 10117 TaxID=1296121 RepID=A0A1A6AAS1_9TREE|nr:uncharacterized protein I303_03185 [Kwoniella dejecticola CBS 10117]OBR87161.1 hypothetical protein I303_03185 [Kwoniella dejecticola CBS 10117]
MPEFIYCPCQVPDCKNEVIKYSGYCNWYMRVYCLPHRKDAVHECKAFPKSLDRKALLPELRKIRRRAELEFIKKLLDQIHASKDYFIREAESLRIGHTCQLDILDDVEVFRESTRLGSFNIHIPILFDDGVKWLIRIRRDSVTIPDPEINNAIIESEVATMRVLKTQGMPVPQGFLPPHHGQSDGPNEREPPFSYSFCEFMEGRPYNVLQTGSLNLPEDDLYRFIDNYAKVQIRLSEIKLPFTQIGRIYFRDLSHGDYTSMIARPPHFEGPFSTNKERYLARIDAALELIHLGALRPTNKALDNYLWHLEMRELVRASTKLAERPQELFIKPDDEKGDHMMIDESGKISGVIDWEWAHVTTKAEAFTPHWIFSFAYGGPNKMTENENKLIEAYKRHNRPDLAECVKTGRFYHRLGSIGYFYQVLKKEAHRAVFGKDIPKNFRPPPEDVDWRVYMMNRYKDDEGLKKNMSKHKWTLERAEREAQAVKQAVNDG